ncbi:hypothetical protein BGZ76_008420 [Entomortierella beljakovae]|nr:hypothetical protein BGZ76_008420 [Entomortierella beljakovae]
MAPSTVLLSNVQALQQPMSVEVTNNNTSASAIADIEDYGGASNTNGKSSAACLGNCQSCQDKLAGDVQESNDHHIDEPKKKKSGCSGSKRHSRVEVEVA